LPPALQSIIDLALAKEPKDRYSTMHDLKAAIKDLRRGLRMDSSERPGYGSRPRTRPRWMAPAAAVLVIVVALAAWKFLPTGGGEAEATDHALAVVAFRDLNTPDDLHVSAGMTELVNIGLIENSPIRVVSPEYLQDLRRRLFGSGRGPIEDDQILEVARKAGATLLLSGRMGRIGDEQFVTWRLVDTRNGESVEAKKVEGRKLTTLVDRILAGVLPVVSDVCGIEVATTQVRVDRITTDSPDAYGHYIAGVLFKERTNSSQARDEWENAVAVDSTFALAHLELGRLYVGEDPYFRDLGKSHSHLEKADALKARLGSRDRLRLEAAFFDTQRKVSKSIAAYEEILKQWPDDRQALTELMGMLFRYWDLGGAGEIAEIVSELYPDYRENVIYIYCEMLIGVGRPNEALDISREFVKQNPDYAQSWATMGRALKASGEPDSAALAYQKAEILDPQVGGQYELAKCGYHAGDLDQAIALLGEYLGNNELADSTRRWLMTATSVSLGLSAYYYEGGRYKDMLAVGGEARQFSGVNPSGTAWDEGMSLLYTGQAQEALEIAEGMPGRYADVQAPWYSLRLRARALTALGNFEGARKAVEELYAYQERFGPQAHMLAMRIEVEIALAENDATKAFETLEKMNKQGVLFGGFFDIEYREARARAHWLTGEFSEAAAIHNEILRIYGGHALSHYELGLIYLEMERPLVAKQAFAKFLEMWSKADEGLPQLVDARQKLAALE
jgi:tetratricopeptide (TPR) repeat protein/TolB-like protein